MPRSMVFALLLRHTIHSILQGGQDPHRAGTCTSRTRERGSCAGLDTAELCDPGLFPLRDSALATHRVGEYVVPGMPVVTISDLAHVWLRASLNETDVGRVKLGQRVHVTSGMCPGKIYEGCLSSIAAEDEVAPETVQPKKERANLVYRVKKDVANSALELKSGMRADADILLNEKCG
jgi:HlyD family secretion protein